jgi:hypothetical protein
MLKVSCSLIANMIVIVHITLNTISNVVATDHDHHILKNLLVENEKWSPFVSHEAT